MLSSIVNKPTGCLVKTDRKGGAILARHPEVYRDPQWKIARRYVIARSNGLCEICMKSNKVKPGKEVDHIIELTHKNKHDWNIAYNPENLQYLCTDCHNHKHDRSIGLQEFTKPIAPSHKCIGCGELEYNKPSYIEDGLRCTKCDDSMIPMKYFQSPRIEFKNTNT